MVLRRCVVAERVFSISSGFDDDWPEILDIGGIMVVVVVVVLVVVVVVMVMMI